MANGLGVMGLFNKGYIKVFSGTQPATADAAETGTLLGVVSLASGTLTKETRATGSVTLATGASGSVDTVTVGGLNIIPDGAVNFNTSLNQTASDLCDAINRNGIMEATVSGAVVTLKGRPGTGVTTAAVATTLTTITTSIAAMGSGVAGVAPINGLILGPAALGVISKPAAAVWSFAGINGTASAGWFRFCSSDTTDSGAVISSILYPRIDGSIATSGADLNLSNISITTGSSNTLDSFSITMPAQ